MQAEVWHYLKRDFYNLKNKYENSSKTAQENLANGI